MDSNSLSHTKWNCIYHIVFIPIMGYLKGKSALMIFDKHPQFKKKGQGRHFWATGYYVDTVGRNEEQIKRYIAEQREADRIESE